jgi:hypothetical protein
MQDICDCTDDVTLYLTLECTDRSLKVLLHKGGYEIFHRAGGRSRSVHGKRLDARHCARMREAHPRRVRGSWLSVLALA